MLNEVLEYEEYDKDKRPSSKVFSSKELTGIRRPLLIIARKKLDEEGFFEADDDHKDEIIMKVTAALEEYCRKKKVPDKKTEEFKKTSVYKMDDRSKTAKNPGAGFHQSTVYKITFDDVIAEAVHLGPLKRRYLTCRDLEFTSIMWDGNLLDAKKAKKKEYIDRMFKLISCCLIRKSYSGQDENVVSWTDIAEWAGKGSFEFDKNFSKFAYCKGGDKLPVFEKRKIGNTVVKIKINQEFMKDFDFQITDRKPKNMPEGYVCYQDLGTGKLMEKLIR